MLRPATRQLQALHRALHPRTVAAAVPSAFRAVSPCAVPGRLLSATPRVPQETQAWKLSHQDVETLIHGGVPISDADEIFLEETNAGLTVHEMVKNDHNSFRGLLWKYHLAGTNNEKLRVLHTLIREISVHSACEELVIHPVLVEYANVFRHTHKPDTDLLHEQHGQIRKSFYELSSMITRANLRDESDKAEIDKALANAMRLMDDHMRIEEIDVTELTNALPEVDLQELGAVFEKAKRNAVLSTSSGPGDGIKIDVALHPSGKKVIADLVHKLEALT